MYLSNFEAKAYFGGMSARVHGLSFALKRRAAAVDFFSLAHVLSKMKRRQQIVLSFLSASYKSRRQASKLELFTVSVAVVKFPRSFS